MISHERDFLLENTALVEKVLTGESEDTKNALEALKGFNDNNILASLQTRGNALADLLVGLSKDSFRNNDSSTLEKYAAIVCEDKTVAYVVFVDGEGKILTTSSVESENKTGIMEIIKPVEHEGVLLGKIKIGLFEFSYNQQATYAKKEISSTLALKLERMETNLT